MQEDVVEEQVTLKELVKPVKMAAPEQGLP